MIKVNPYREVVITRPCTVVFLTENANNDLLLGAVDEMVARFCKMTKQFMDDHAKNEHSKKESSALLEYMQSLEKTFETQLGEMKVSVEKSVSDATSRVGENVMGQISGLAVVVNQTVSSALSNLNVSSISQQLNESIQIWLGDTLRESHDDMKSLTSLIESNLKQHVVENVMGPVMKSQDIIIKQIELLPDHISNQLQATDVSKQLGDIKKDWEKNISQVRDKLDGLDDSLNGCIKSMITSQSEETKRLTDGQRHIISKVSDIPNLTKSVISDVLSKLYTRTSEVNSTINRIETVLKENTKSVGDANVNTKSLMDKIGGLETRVVSANMKNSTSAARGNDGEERIHQMLSDKLMMRDGYTVERVNGSSFSCDIVVKRDQYPTVRIESKAVGKETGDKVKSKDVEKFQRDLLQLNNHGIMVSLYSGIVGVSNFEIQQLPNGKFAIYLTNNKYDIDIVINMINLLYTLENIVSKGKEHGDSGVKVSQDTLLRVKGCIQEYNNKIQSIKAHLRDSMALLSDMKMDEIERMLFNQIESDCKEVVKCEYECNWCKKGFKSKSGHTVHIKTCSSRPKTT